MGMDRYWLLTCTTYGTWLPGDERGFVSNVQAGPDRRVRHNQFQTEFDRDHHLLRHSAKQNMKGDPVFLMAAQAQVVLKQFQETARHRRWLLAAAAIMRNHFHAVVGVEGDPDPETLLRDLKSYASRALNKRWTRPVNGTWWTESGSRRKLGDMLAVTSGVQYVKEQEFPLAMLIADEFSGETPLGIEK
jgi:REP element-mobilizing transposase RayT